MRRYLFAVLAAGGALFASGPSPAAADPLRVVASFSILADMVRQIGGDAVQVTPLVGPDSDVHVFEPTPASARSLAGADLVVINGLGLEGWIERLIAASGYRGQLVVATAGVQPLKAEEEEEDEADHASHEHGGHEHGGHDHGEHDHGGLDPHAWESVPNAVAYTRTIEQALVERAPAAAAAIRQRADAYRTELDALDLAIRTAWSTIPRQDRIAIVPHQAFNYYGQAYGVTFLSPVGTSTEDDPSAKDLARLVALIKRHRARALFTETSSNPRLIAQIAEETGVAVGGRLYSGALSAPTGPAATYLGMMRSNTAAFVNGLGGKF